MLYALATGAFAKAGLDVQVTLLGSGSAAAAAVAGGTLQIAKSSSLPLVAAHARGLPFTIVTAGTISTLEHPSSVIVVKADSPLKTPRDFTGKTFGQNSLGDVGVLLSRGWLDANGGDAKTLKFVEMPGTAVGPALAEGRIDAATLRNPGLAAVIGRGLRQSVRASGRRARQAAVDQRVVHDDMHMRRRIAIRSNVFPP